MAADDDVQLTDLEVIQQFSLAVRGTSAPRAEVIAALQSDLEYLTRPRRRTAAPAPAPAPARVAGPARAAAPAAGRGEVTAGRPRAKGAARTPAAESDKAVPGRDQTA